MTERYIVHRGSTLTVRDSLIVPGDGTWVDVIAEWPVYPASADQRLNAIAEAKAQAVCDAMNGTPAKSPADRAAGALGAKLHHMNAIAYQIEELARQIQEHAGTIPAQKRALTPEFVAWAQKYGSPREQMWKLFDAWEAGARSQYGVNDTATPDDTKAGPL